MDHVYCEIQSHLHGSASCGSVFQGVKPLRVRVSPLVEPTTTTLPTPGSDAVFGSLVGV